MKSYIITIISEPNSCYIERLESYYVKATNEENAIKNMLNSDDIDYCLIYSILLEMENKQLLEKSKKNINVLVTKLIKNFKKQKLDEADEDDNDYINFLNDNIDDFIFIFHAYCNVEFIKIKLIK